MERCIHHIICEHVNMDIQLYQPRGVHDIARPVHYADPSVCLRRCGAGSGRTAQDLACYFPSWAADVAKVFGTTVAAMCKRTQKRQVKMRRKNATAYQPFGLLTFICSFPSLAVLSLDHRNTTSYGRYDAAEESDGACRYEKALNTPEIAAQLAVAARSAAGGAVGGAWLSSEIRPGAAAAAAGDGSPPSTTVVESRCDVDVRVGLQPLDFADDYFLLNRPVLLRGALAGKQFDQLRKRWKRSKFAKHYGAAEFKRESIPYAVRQIASSLARLT